MIRPSTSTPFMLSRWKKENRDGQFQGQAHPALKEQRGTAWASSAGITGFPQRLLRLAASRPKHPVPG